jgi:hypothetical protein
MIFTKNRIIALSGLAILSGCANITLPVITPPAPPITVKESVSQICKEADENQVRANQYYNGKTLTITGEVASVNELFNPRYRIYMIAGKKLRIHASTENQAYAMKLTNGKQATVTGIIQNLTYDHNGCSISLKDAHF